MLITEAPGLIIDWTQMPTYNTIMSIAAGAGLISLVYFAKALMTDREVHLDSWSIAFAVPGVILFTTGLHMTLTWPFAKYFPFDNIIFGETSFGFGVLLLFAAFYLWKRNDKIMASGDAAAYLGKVSRPISLMVVGLGLALIAIAFAGVIFQLFAAPPEEPITGAFAEWPWMEALFMSGMFAVVGVGAVLFPLALREFRLGAPRTTMQWIVGLCWGLAGLGFFLFGALNFFTHIGLIVNTMG
ncbi:DUF981 domain-containing protein [Leucobacter sp. M11]|uniref:DUF981 domain-containing protein n=1 Tax=Leucobacter sp. M11 TaxID=2993565 RepID=UPI002D7E3A66|nr:DUF981 domain-containing protein [Leucobacter sp. M11]MEB4613255.1 DUF981 domain-containing protein [Leucobacter sp. M11]